MQVNPIELLKEEMREDCVSLRVNAIHRLEVLVSLLPP